MMRYRKLGAATFADPDSLAAVAPSSPEAARVSADPDTLIVVAPLLSKSAGGVVERANDAHAGGGIGQTFRPRMARGRSTRHRGVERLHRFRRIDMADHEFGAAAFVHPDLIAF